MTELTGLFSGVLAVAWRACPALLVVLLARLLLCKAPARVWRPLWWGAFFRLVCPFAYFLSVRLPGAPRYSAQAFILGANAPLPAEQTLSPALSPTLPEGAAQATAPLFSSLDIASAVWLVGLALMLVWGLVSFLRFSRCLVGAVRLRDNIWLADQIPAPVTVGALRPRIYLPSSLEEREQEYVLLHERQHIRWGDQLFKLVAFLILAVHWFHPLAWAAFLLACRDLEAACDQGVLAKTGETTRQEYAAALLHLSTGRKILAGGPLSFGEGDAKGRIRRVMDYRKAPRWATGIAKAVAACAIFIALLGPNLVLEAAEDRSFTPYDSFSFSLEPGEAADYQTPIAITETTDLCYQVNWTPMGLNIELVLGAEEGPMVGNGPALLVDGRGGELSGVFSDIPTGEYRLIVRSAAQGREEGELTITGAAAFGWQEAGEWKLADTSRRTAVTFPAYQEGRRDYNAAIYDIDPFQLAIALPEGWSVRVPPTQERGTTFAFTPLWLYQGEEYAGSIGYNTFEVYPDVPPENFYRMVYNQLMLGSVVNWDSDYTVVRDWGSGCAATVQIMERTSYGGIGETGYRPGILAYDQDMLVYVAIDLENGRLSNQEVWELAESLVLFRTEEAVIPD